jgi:Protein of unknown function (DUF2510)
MSAMDPGFYPDIQGVMRWWDGQQWTQNVMPPPRKEKKSLRLVLKILFWWVPRFFNLGDKLYAKVQAPAQTLKAVMQMVIGGVALWKAILSLYHKHNQVEKVALSDFADSALTIVGVALAVSAVVELAYTFLYARAR